MIIAIQKVKNKIHLKSQWRADIPIKCKTVNGARWSPQKKVWTFPLDWNTCLELREAFGDELKVMPELADWARRERDRIASLADLAALDESDLASVAEVAPRLDKAMRSRAYQTVGSAWIARAGSALLADQPGLGKTLQAMGAIIERGITGPILVFAPKTAALITWPNEIRKWLDPETDSVTVVSHLTGPKRREALKNFREDVELDAKFSASEMAKDAGEKPQRHWLICNIEMVRSQKSPNSRYPDEGLTKWSSKDKDTGKIMKGVWHHAYGDLFRTPWRAIIIDESHKALITRTGKREDQSLQRAGFGLLPLAENGLKLCMSGTPFRGKLENLWGTLNWLRPDRYTSFWKWIERWFECFNDGFSTLIGDLRPELEEKFYKELDAIMLRRTKAEVLPDLPPKMYAGEMPDNPEWDGPPGIWLPMDSQQAKAYREMEMHAATELEGGHLTANGVMAEMVRLKQFASCCGKLENGIFQPTLPSNKFDWIWNFLLERGIADEAEDRNRKATGGGYTMKLDAKNKVIIASQFTKLINVFAAELQRLGVECHVLTGETKNADRIRIEREFQADGGPRVFFLNTNAGGVSLTLDAADELIFIDETWIPDEQEQVEDRIHRASRMHQVTIYYLRTLDTIEETIANTVSDREALQKNVLDGRRGVEFAKKLVGVEK